MVHLEKRRFAVVNSQQIILLVIPPIFLAITTAVLVVRWRARLTKRVNTLLEDLLCLCALIMCSVVVVLLFILVLLDGQGMSTQQVEAHFGEQLQIRDWLRTQFAVDVCWATSVTAIQLSLVHFYARIYEARPTLYCLCYLMGTLRAFWFVYAIAAWAYFCHPPGNCTLASKENCRIIGSLHLSLLALGIGLVLPSLIEMDLTRTRKKLSVVGLMTLGTFCTVCAVLRMDCLFSFFANYEVDPIGAARARMLFSPLEIAVGIIATSIPTLTSFHEAWQTDRRQLPKESGMHSLRRLKFRSSSNGSSTSNLNPANWVGKNAGYNNAFVSLADVPKSSERVRDDLRDDDIKVVKEVTVVHKT